MISQANRKLMPSRANVTPLMLADIRPKKKVILRTVAG